MTTVLNYPTGDPYADVPPPDTPPGEETPRGRASWRPMDLGPYLRGEVQPEPPSVGWQMSNGKHLLYPGKEHAINAEMEAGKTWFSVACVAAELRKGNPVAYIHFEEVDPMDVVTRLLALDVDADTIADLLLFCGPTEPATPYDVADLVACAPTLVVLDGVNAGMALHGMDIFGVDGPAAFRQRFVSPFLQAGAATLACDHVVKNRETRGRYAFGGVHKGNANNGATFMLENVEPFGRGMRGRSSLYVTKDRPGFLRQDGKPVRDEPSKTYIGSLVVDATNPAWLELEVYAYRADAEPPPGVDDAPGDSIDDEVYRVVCELHANGAVNVTQRKVRAVAGYGTDRTIAALDRLVISGRLVTRPGPRNSTLFVPAESTS